MSAVERSGFFDAGKQLPDGSYDIEYSSDDFAKLFGKFIGNGVFVDPADQLKVRAKKGLTVEVQRGWAYIDGYWYELEQDTELAFEPNTKPETSKNVVIVSLNRATKKIHLDKKQGVLSTKPENNGSVHELVLCEFLLGVGVAEITNSIIQDRRPEKEYCGYVTGLVNQVDFSSMFLQVTGEAEEWLTSLKGKLGEEPATSLQLQINKIVDERIRTLTSLKLNVETGRFVDATVVKQVDDRIDSILGRISPKEMNLRVGGAGSYVYNLENRDYVRIFDLPPKTTGYAIVTNGDYGAVGGVMLSTYVYSGGIYVQFPFAVKGLVRLNWIVFLTGDDESSTVVLNQDGKPI